MSEKIDDVTNSWAFRSLRFLLIKLIAGKATVLLNAKIEMIDRRPEYCGSVSGNTFFISNCGFQVSETQMLRITKQVKP